MCFTGEESPSFYFSLSLQSTVEDDGRQTIRLRDGVAFFTEQTKVVPRNRTTSHDVAKAFPLHCVFHSESQGELLSYNDLLLTRKLYINTFRTLVINNNFTSACHAQPNGIVEHLNLSIANILHCYIACVKLQRLHSRRQSPTQRRFVSPTYYVYTSLIYRRPSTNRKDRI